MVASLNRAQARELVGIFGAERALTRPEELVCYSSDASRIEAEPMAVVFPVDAREVSGLVRFCADAGLALYPRGAGTGYAGGVTPGPEAPGVVCDFTRMNRIDPVDLANATVRVEPGVVTGKLQAEVEALGLFYPPDPSSLGYCTIGGNVATNAGGPRCLKYGVTRRYITALEAVSAQGEYLELGRNLAKDAVGYDIRNLIVGSEGTLAVVTGIRLALAPLPASRITVEAGFDSAARAVELVSLTLREGTLPAKIELLDRNTALCIEQFGSFGLRTDLEALIGVELDGDPESCRGQARTVDRICQKLGAEHIEVKPDRGSRFWEARSAVSAAIHRLKPMKINEDATVPRSELPEAVDRIKALAAAHGVTVLLFGHVGDGNLHVNFLWDPAEGDARPAIAAALDDLFELIQRLGGSVSGEHGVGLAKLDYAARQLGPEVLALNRELKRIMDPGNMLNPGKKIPAARGREGTDHWPPKSNA